MNLSHTPTHEQAGEQDGFDSVLSVVYPDDPKHEQDHRAQKQQTGGKFTHRLFPPPGLSGTLPSKRTESL